MYTASVDPLEAYCSLRKVISQSLEGPQMQRIAYLALRRAPEGRQWQQLHKEKGFQVVEAALPSPV